MSRPRLRPVGLCRVCLELKPLTFEHLPPRRAFNDTRATVFGMQNWLERENTGGVMTGGTIQQRGMGGFTLCETCNNNTGAWYGAELVTLARTGRRLLSQLPLRDLDQNVEPEYVFVTLTAGPGQKQPRPLRIIKQVVAMILSANGADFAAINHELGEFVREKHKTSLSSRYQFHLALYAGPGARRSGVSATLGFPHGVTLLSTEISAPPFSYSMTLDAPPDAVPTQNITEMADVAYNVAADIGMSLLVGFGHTPFPLDYRSKARMELERRMSA